MTGSRSSSEDNKKLHGADIEKGGVDEAENEVLAIENLDDGVPRNQGVFRSMWALVQKLDRFGFEARGIERVPPTQRTQLGVRDSFTMWFAANMTISTFSLGTLGAAIFDLGLRDAILTIIFFNLLSTAPVAWFSSFGARTGLRQMVFSRYSFGYWTCMIPGVLNVIATIGWSTINTIVGAQTLNAISDSHSLPIAAGVVIIALLTLVPSFAGYRFVHAYERWAAIVPGVIFIIMLGEGAKAMVSGPWGGSGPVEAGAVLSFGASVVGFGLGWVSYASDYTVNMPEDTSATKIFWAVYTGLNIPLILIECLGAAFMTTFTAKPAWGALYDAHGVGGLIVAGLTPLGGFGRFLSVLMALSIVANNIPNIYSLSLTVQIFGPLFQAVPRLFITVMGTGVYIALAIAGASHFDSVLDTLLVLLSYWLAIYFAIVAAEHLIFRRGRWANYDFTAVGDAKRLPPGIAALLALCCGIVGAVLGMSQLWYIGVLGRKIGDPAFGGDIGFELSFAFTALTYPPLRYLELKYFSR